MSLILVGRQPICDRRLEVQGYELLYRTVDGVFDPSVDGNVATATVAANALLQIGLDQLVGSRKAFVNMTREFLVDGLYQVLPAGTAVLEVLETIEPDDEVVAAVRRAAGLGYQVALDDFVYDERYEPLLELVRYVKVNLPSLESQEDWRGQVERLQRPGLTLLAEKVESHEDYRFCRDAGYDLFQGYFFCRPDVIRRKGIQTNKMTMLRLLARIQDPDIDVRDIEEILKSDVSLGYMLLRTVNSAFYALPVRVESIHQTIVMLGLERIRRCVTLILMASIDDKPPELMITGLVRARTCELLGGDDVAEDSHKRFTVGLLSVLDALADCSMQEVLGTIPLADDVEEALLRRTGRCGAALRAVLGCERGDVEAIRATGFAMQDVQTAYFDALIWTDRVREELAVFGRSG